MDEIKDLLVKISKDISDLKKTQEEIRLEQAVFEKAVMDQFNRIDNKLDSLDTKFDSLQEVTKDNLFDITLLKKHVR